MGAAEEARPHLLRHRQPPGRPGGVRPHRRAAQVHPARRTSGATAIRRACASAPRANCADTAKAAAKFGVKTVNGFTGSSIWHAIYAFPPTTQAYWDAGFADFGRRFGPILDAFDKADVNFALEVHPTEIAFDIASAQRAIEAVKGHKRFGFNYDPSHLGYQGVDYVKFMRTFPDRIYHAHMKDVWWGQRRRHGGRVRRPHQLRRRAPLLGLPQRRARHGRFRAHHRRAQRHRLRGPAVGRVGRQPHGPRSRRHRKRGILPAAGLQTGRRRIRRGLFAGSSRDASSAAQAALCHGRWWPRGIHRCRAPQGHGTGWPDGAGGRRAIVDTGQGESIRP